MIMNARHEFPSLGPVAKDTHGRPVDKANRIAANAIKGIAKHGTIQLRRRGGDIFMSAASNRNACGHIVGYYNSDAKLDDIVEDVRDALSMS